ncbi:MAB_1171c family putative transporter [Nocardia sp. NPDC057272]|uniref:MAB_1171c family putative transporter n=1 Tax=Nocardia sp. NPDC057272 TaxID=3346079 RepID=UPI0036445527
MNTFLYASCAITSLVALLFRLPALIRGRESGQFALCAYFAISASTFGISIPAVYESVTRLSGIPNLAGLLAQCGGVSIAVAQQAVVLSWDHPWILAKRKIFRRLALLAATLTCMITLFTLSEPQMVDSPHNFAANSAIIPTYSIYLLVFQGCFIIGTLESVRLCWRYSVRVGPGWLRVGLRVAMIGSGLGLPYSAVRVSSVVIAHSGGDTLRFEPVARLAAAGGTLALLVGWTIPAWGPLLSSICARILRYRTYRRIGPLWRAMCDSVPEVVLNPSPRNGIYDRKFRQLDFRLYRRIVEIRDARMALLPYFEAGVAEKVKRKARDQGKIDLQLAAVVEAATLAVAIERKRMLHDSAAPSIAFHTYHFEQSMYAGNSLQDELTWLEMVGIEYIRSPFIEIALDLVDVSSRRLSEVID